MFSEQKAQTCENAWLRQLAEVGRENNAKLNGIEASVKSKIPMFTVQKSSLDNYVHQEDDSPRIGESVFVRTLNMSSPTTWAV
jgi:hypothetical protein